MTSRHKTALVVEDSRVQALVIKQLLEDKGLNVICAADGRIGLALAELRKPDVIVLDIEMPEMNGLEACKHLKQNRLTSHIPIVLLTAHDEPAILLEGIGLGAIDFIPKDAFSDKVLLETLRQLKVLDDGWKSDDAQG